MRVKGKAKAKLIAELFFYAACVLAAGSTAALVARDGAQGTTAQAWQCRRLNVQTRRGAGAAALPVAHPAPWPCMFMKMAMETLELMVKLPLLCVLCADHAACEQLEGASS
jgi:hypothetical protein